METITVAAVLILTLHMVVGVEEWDYMVFTQQWPQSVCLETKVSHQHECSLAANISTWTIHGIWPTKKGTIGPNFCNNTAKFDPKQLEPIFGLLQKYWPNLYTDTDLYSFWKHEWVKHGTCATGIPSMKGEQNFFNKALKLRSQYDFLERFRKLNFVPDDTYTYQYTKALSIIEKAVGGKVKLQCFYDKSSKTQYLEQIEICLDKTFNVIDCPSNENLEGCYSTEQIAYPPIKHQTK